MSDPQPVPPVAERRPHVHDKHGDQRSDDYHWLRERDDPAVVAYLEAENAYTDAVTADSEPLVDELYAEIVARIQETDLSVPVKHGPYLYYARSVEGLQYPIYCRRPDDGTEASTEQVMLDQNVVGEGQEYCSLGALEVSPDHRLLLWSVDLEGDEEHVLRVRDLDRGTDLADEVPGTSYGVAWASDNRTVFYTTLDEAKRPYRVWRHHLGSDPAADIIVHQEDDERFFVSVSRTRSGAYLLIDLQSAVTSEVLALPADQPDGDFTVIEPRRQGIEYRVEHHGERFFIVTNDGAANFRLMEAPIDRPGRAQWAATIPYDSEIKLEGVSASSGHLVLLERAAGVTRMRALDLATGEEHVVDQPEAVCTVGVNESDNLEFDTDVVRYTYTSLVTPSSVYDYDLRARERVLRKQQPVLGGYDPAAYVTERLWATAKDGTQVPISLVARAGTPRDGIAPALLYGYGSYEHSSEPRFSSLRLSLLDRGFVWAIAHVRGGGEMGRAWYDDGKLAAKPNTFSDFIACAQHLVDEGWTTPARLTALGGSAGGLLMGAVVNERPDLFRAVVAEVPFVDVVTTILDESLPLSVVEWEEWGNPNDPAFYETMKSYSPYDNVRAQAYPDLLVTGGLNDPRVSYWEPAKWVAKLRALKQGDSRLLLKMDMGAGHGGPSGRYDAWRRDAFIYAFLLRAVGVS